jgi:transposase
MLLMAIEARYPGMRFVHVFLDNARYHHAKLVQAWLARSGCRIQLHFIPAYCPHLNSIKRLWGLMRDRRKFGGQAAIASGWVSLAGRNFCP